MATSTTEVEERPSSIPPPPLPPRTSVISITSEDIMIPPDGEPAPPRPPRPDSKEATPSPEPNLQGVGKDSAEERCV